VSIYSEYIDVMEFYPAKYFCTS